MQDADDFSTQAWKDAKAEWYSDTTAHAVEASVGFACGLVAFGLREGAQTLKDQLGTLALVAFVGSAAASLTSLGLAYVRRIRKGRDDALALVREHEELADTAVAALLARQDTYYYSALGQEPGKSITAFDFVGCVGALIVDGAFDQAIKLELAKIYGSGADMIYGHMRDRLLDCGVAYSFAVGDREVGLKATDSGRRIIKEILAKPGAHAAK